MCTQYFIIYVFILFLFYVIIRTSLKKKGVCPKFHFRIVKEALENICYKKELLGMIG